MVRELNLNGDRAGRSPRSWRQDQGGLSYPSEHYEFWRPELPRLDLNYGVFGENLTTQGILEADVRPGDKLRIGTAEFSVTMPRYPCFKLGIRFPQLEGSSGAAPSGSSDIIRRFVKAGRSGLYLEVLKTGQLAAGDQIELVPDGSGKSIHEIYRERLGQRG